MPPGTAGVALQSGRVGIALLDGLGRLGIGATTAPAALSTSRDPGDRKAEIRAEVIDNALVRTLWLVPHAVEVRVAHGVGTLEGELERRSDLPVAPRLVGGIDGVVGGVDWLSARYDAFQLPPTEPELRGLGAEWPRKR